MKKLLLTLSFSAFLMANIVDDELIAYDTGDYEKALFYKEMCDDGYPIGCFSLGVSYAKGEGVKQDFQKAVSLFQKACDDEYPIGCFSLGALYYNGKGVEQNKIIAKKYYGKACDMGEQIGCDNYKELDEQGY